MSPGPANRPGGDPKADCYSGGERAWMERGQALRARMLGPVLHWMGTRGVRPDHLTLLSLAAGLSFCPLWFWSPPWALVALWMHVILDGIDGPLARHLGIESSRGSFTDTMADQTVVTASTIALIYAGAAAPVAGSLYLYTYVLVVALAMARNALSIPYAWLVRPRLIVYGWIALDWLLWPGSLDWVLGGSAAALGVKVLTGFLQMRRRMTPTEVRSDDRPQAGPYPAHGHRQP